MSARDRFDALLRAPIQLDDRPGRTWPYHPWITAVVSLFVAYHAFVLTVHNLPAKGLTRGLHTFVNDKLGANTYIRLTSGRQSWNMFAPDPHRSNTFVRVLVKDQNGDVWDLGHDIYGRRPYPYLFYDRFGKINRRLLEQSGYQRPYAAWVCREWEADHGGEPPVEVQLVKMWSRVPPPREAYKNMGFDPMALTLNRNYEAVLRCDELTHGQLPDRRRARLGLPPLSPGTFKEQPGKTWWEMAEDRARAAKAAAAPVEPGPEPTEEPVERGPGEGGQ